MERTQLSRRTIIAVSIFSVLLLVYMLLFLLQGPFAILFAIFLTLPFALIGVVYIILKDDRYNGRELEPDEEYGYEDKRTEELGMF